jgi:phosphoribosylaminoimidazole-succinocarboxamide synthase
MPRPFYENPIFEGRTTLARKTDRIDFECVVRGYLAGSGWKDYQATGEICGIALPPGMKLSERLPEPIFTPATKAAVGEHDENVGFEQMKNSLGEIADRLKDISVAIYKEAAAVMESQGILLCDTKFEFGMLGDRIVLIDEILTPDSSRYWDTKTYEPGKNQAGFDKQYIRDYVESLGWDKKPPAPRLPASVVENTIKLYGEIQERIQKALGVTG